MINWPERFKPGHAPVHVRNLLTMTASPEAVWAWLIRAERWPTWYKNAHDVRIAEGMGPDLGPETRFTWRTFGVSLVSKVEEFVPGERLAWSGTGFGVDVYHAWRLTPTADGGCEVLTEESQYGLLARLQAIFLPNRMCGVHQIWLEVLAAQAAGGPPS